jgi:membrane-bound metal-dependent hydrolase YbcI (DUF457 family)
MLIWFAALSIAGVFLVFRDPAIDYRLIALGSLLPDPIDAVLRRGIGPLHSVVTAVAVLVVVMLATIGRRVLRRKLLAIPIGLFAHLVLDNAWSTTTSFWWPLAGRVGRASLPVVERGPIISVIQEFVGLAVAVWLYRRFQLRKPTLRKQFVRTGRIHRNVR